ncbi:hypothetical protein J1N35_021691 [Gossypium stocksii]|uniref:Uncharacterized protein n=1 Tax=Gossypium stocksii TaxID=47602 RepID=A0A9D3VF16_9ROSI|nr:hypothetical protein J1N35_021691 [Gossypium stocksii]
MNIDLVLGLNLEGSLSSFAQSMKNLLMDKSQNDMEHDLEDGVLIGEEEKNRNRRVMEESSSREGSENFMVLEEVYAWLGKWKLISCFKLFPKDILMCLLMIMKLESNRDIQIPLAETDYEDRQVWKGEQSDEYSVRSAYKLLQDSTLNPRRGNLVQKILNHKAEQDGVRAKQNLPDMAKTHRYKETL